MFTRLIPVALVAALASSLALVESAHAEGDVPVIARITTENTGGGLTPYAPLYTYVALTFTDSTPSDHVDYRVLVAGIGSFEAADGPGAGEFSAHIPSDGMEAGTSYDFTVEETNDQGEVVSHSAPQAWTYRFVKHPGAFSTSSKQVRGQWSYRAGSTARFSFTGTWEKGTRFSTQVWVSRTKRFTADDYADNTRRGGALVTQYDATSPVLSVRIPRRLQGRYVWVSVLGWKNGKAGWRYTVPVEKVIAPR